MRRSNTKIILSILLTILVLAVFPTAALAAPSNALVIGNSYTLQTGQTLNDQLFVVGGSVNLMSGSTINGSVIVIGGSVEAAGTINGNMFVLGGTVNLGSTFILNGDLTSGGAALTRDPGAQIHGQVHVNEPGSSITLPGQIQIPNINFNVNPLFNVLGFFIRLFLWVLAAMILAMFIPNHLWRTAQAVITQPLIAGGLGLVTIIIVPIILVLLAITICLIPVSLLGIILLVVAWVFGLISLGYELGKRISSASKVEWHPALSAGLGTLILMLGLNGITELIPCVGWIPKFLVGLFGLGAVLLTQFGVKAYTPTPSLPSANPPVNLPPANSEG